MSESWADGFFEELGKRAGVEMSEDKMPDVIYAELYTPDIGLPNNLHAETWEIKNGTKYYSESHVQHLIDQAKAEQREKLKEQATGLKHNLSVIHNELSQIPEEECTLSVWDRGSLALESTEASLGIESAEIEDK